MKFSFGKGSMENYHTLTPKLQKIAWTALNLDLMDFAIVCGHRNEVEQTKAFNEKRSKVKWPNSKHNSFPAKAMDCVPYIAGKLSWNKFHCCVLAGLILAEAKHHGISLRWGGNWDMDSEPITDQDFQDLVHFEEAA